MQALGYGLIALELLCWGFFTYWFFGWFVGFFEELCGWGHPLAAYSKHLGFVLALGVSTVVSEVVGVFYKYSYITYIAIGVAFPVVSIFTMFFWILRKKINK